MRGDTRPRVAKPPGASGTDRARDVACLTQAIDNDVIPRLARRHRNSAPAGSTAAGSPARDVETYLQHVLAGRQAEMDGLVAQWRQAGLTIESVYLELLKPVARRLGELWSDDEADFAQVTVATGRLQRVLRELSPAFAAEGEAAAQAHRALFVQAEGEQHSFGLSMMAEFFRRAGWDVMGGVGTAAGDPAERVKREWVDVVGLSIGSLPRLEAMKQLVVRLRAASLNPALAIMVGGPLFHQHPELLAQINADGNAPDAREALRRAEALVRERQARRPGA